MLDCWPEILRALLLARTEGKDHPVLEIHRATQFVAAYDQEYALMRRMAHELKMF